VRHQIAVIEPLEAVPEDESLVVTVAATEWLGLLAGQRSFPVALADGTIKVSGGLADTARLVRFLALFRQE
jgi:hypothetical protein